MQEVQSTRRSVQSLAQIRKDRNIFMSDCHVFACVQVAVTDSYMMEGIKVLYRVVLAIIILFTKHTGHGRRGAASNNAGHSIGEFCRHLPVPPSKLLKVCMMQWFT